MAKPQSENNKYKYNPLYDEHLKGLSGWLVIVGLGIFYSLLINLHFILTDVINNGGWAVLMQPFNDVKTNEINWVPVIVVLLYFLTTILLVQLLILYFFKNKNFPKWFISFKLIALILIFLDAYFVYYELPYHKELREQTLINLVISIVGALIWIPYMLLSRRVRFTFVH